MDYGIMGGKIDEPDLFVPSFYKLLSTFASMWCLFYPSYNIVFFCLSD